MELREAEGAGARLTLVPLAVAYAEAMAEVLADPALYTFTGGGPPTVRELRERYARQVAGSPDPAVSWLNFLLVPPEGGVAGYVQATVDEGARSAELAWVVGSDRQGRGYAKEGARLLVALLARRGARELTAHVHPEHAASEAVARSLGLSPTETLQEGERRWEGRVPHAPAAQPAEGEDGGRGS